MNGGVVFYTIIDGRIHFLLQHKQEHKKKNKWIYEDLGGKKEENDNSAEEVAAREAAEESNGVFISNYIPKRLLQNLKYEVIIKTCKNYLYKLIKNDSIKLVQIRTGYNLFLVKIDYIESEVFGEKEIHERYNINRRMVWLNEDDLKSIEWRNIHPRIRHFHNKIKFNRLHIS